MMGDDQEKIRYNQGNDINTKLLQGAIPRYDRNLLDAMINECGFIVDRVDGIRSVSYSDARDPYARIVPWTIKNVYKRHAFYLLKFTTPVIRHVPTGFQILHFKFRDELSGYEYIPCYLLNINHVALAKSYVSKHDPLNKMREPLFSEFGFSGGRSMELSSLNILLPGSTQKYVQDSRHSVISKCFENCYWRLPAPINHKDLSHIHNLIYHTNSDVKDILQLRKTLLRIIKIDRDESHSIACYTDPVECVRAEVVLLVWDGEKIVSDRRRMLVTKSVVSSAKEGELINAIVVMRDAKSRGIPMVVGNAGKSIQAGDARLVLALVMWNILQCMYVDSSLTSVGDIEEISDRVADVIASNAGESRVFYPDSAWKFTKNDAERMISDLFPLYIREGRTVYQLSPTILSFLLATAPSLLDERKHVSAIVRMFDLVTANAGKWDPAVRSTVTVREFPFSSTASDLDLLLAYMPVIATHMAYSRIFSDAPNL